MAFGPLCGRIQNLEKGSAGAGEEAPLPTTCGVKGLIRGSANRLQVPGCSNLHRNSFTYHSVTDEGKTVPLEPCLQFIEAVREKGEKVSLLPRSPASAGQHLDNNVHPLLRAPPPLTTRGGVGLHAGDGALHVGREPLAVGGHRISDEVQPVAARAEPAVPGTAPAVCEAHPARPGAAARVRTSGAIPSCKCLHSVVFLEGERPRWT